MGEYLRIGTSLLAAEGGHGHGLSWLGLMIYLGIVLIAIFAILSSAKKDFGSRVFHNKWAQRFEQLYLFIENLCVGIIGPHGRKYMPMMITFWLVIFLSNVLSLFMPEAPTADLSFNLAMALLAIGYVQYEGIRSHGFFGHLKHFSGPKLTGMLIPISGLIFIIEIISECMKNVSLSLRLYGNISGGHQAVSAMNDLGAPIFVPIGFFLMPIKALTCIVQALIFVLLLSVYLSLVTAPHEDDHHEHAEEGKPALAH